MITRIQRSEHDWTPRGKDRGGNRRCGSYKCSRVASDAVSRFHGPMALIPELVRKLSVWFFPLGVLRETCRT
jgi:hypothetical protein